MPRAHPPNARLVTDDLGRLLLVTVRPGPTPHETNWNCLWTRGHRSVSGATGSCVHDGKADRWRQVLSAAKRTAEAGPKEGRQGRESLAGILRPLLREAPAADAEAELVRHFLESCGAATLLVAMFGGDPALLEPADSAHGAAHVDGFAIGHPFLLSLLVRSRAGGVTASAACGILHDGAGLDAGSVLSLSRTIVAASKDMPGGSGDAVARPEVRWDGPRPARAPEFDPANVLARLSRIPMPPCLAAEAMAWSHLVPLDWIPTDEDEAVCYALCVSLAAGIASASGDVLDARSLLAPSRGRWRSFAGRIQALAPSWSIPAPGEWRAIVKRRHALDDEGASIVRGVADMVDAFRSQVAWPTWARSGGIDGSGRDRARVEAGSWILLIGGKGLPGVLQASKAWHDAQADIGLTIRTLGDGRAWPRPFPDFTASNGVVAAPIFSAAGLAEEGAALNHCVGGYVSQCNSLRTVVVSLRRPGGEGGFTRSSTAQISWAPDHATRSSPGWRPSVLQHRKAYNGKPDRADALAARELVAHLADARHGEAAEEAAGERDPLAVRLTRRLRSWEARLAPVHNGWEPDERNPFALPDPLATPGPRAIAEGCGYDWTQESQATTALRAWSPFLPRTARSDLTALGAALGFGAAHGRPASGGPGAGGHDPGLGGPGRAFLSLCGTAGVAALAASLSYVVGAIKGRRSITAPVVILALLLCGWMGSLYLRLVESSRTDTPSERSLVLYDMMERLSRRPDVPCGEAAELPGDVERIGPDPLRCTRAGPLRLAVYGNGYELSYQGPKATRGTVVLALFPGMSLEWPDPKWKAVVMGKLAEFGIAPRPAVERIRQDVALPLGDRPGHQAQDPTPR